MIAEFTKSSISDITLVMTKFITIAGLYGFVGVLLGAFGAHGLEERLEANGHMEVWRTATLYLFVHALALFTLANCQEVSKLMSWIGWLWTCGILLFSGSLYLLALTSVSKLGIITPLGGACFLLGWILLIWVSIRNGKTSVENS